jgi:hypothetical protein
MIARAVQLAIRLGKRRDHAKDCFGLLKQSREEGPIFWCPKTDQDES